MKRYGSYAHNNVSNKELWQVVDHIDDVALVAYHFQNGCYVHDSQ